MFDGHTPGDPVRCPVDGCAFSGAVGQVVSHIVGTDDGDHDAVEREIDRTRTSAEASGDTDRRPAVAEFVRLLEAAHGEREGYESDRGGGWLFPFEGGER